MSECPFCGGVPVVLSNELVFGCLDKNPVTQGHLLLLPRRHVMSWFDATVVERMALLALADEARHWLEQRFSPDGYNLGVNVGATAGQTIPHLHMHLIPRYAGDCADPRGGVRGVIPGRQWYPSEGDMR
jgi:diadenosine tetraphosphate (Ap4A) HIT family hydrolase